MSQTEPNRRPRDGRNSQNRPDPTTVNPPRTNGESASTTTTGEAGSPIGPGQSGFIHPAFAQTQFSVDPRIILDEISRCGRGLQIVAEEFDSKDEKRRQKAHIAGTRYFFYCLGLLQSAGIVLTPTLYLGGEAAKASSLSGACKSAGVSIEKYITDQFGGVTPYGGDIRDLVEKLQDCFSQITVGTYL